MPKQLTILEKLLLAASDLVMKGEPEFTAEDLVIAAWRKYPDAFGLSGYLDAEGKPAYPDSNRVFAEIMGAKPIRKQGYLRKVGTKVYELTEAGRDKADFLANVNPIESPTKASLPRQLEIELKRLLASKPLAKYRTGRADDISFYDACTFWSVTPRSSAS